MPSDLKKNCLSGSDLYKLVNDFFLLFMKINNYVGKSSDILSIELTNSEDFFLKLSGKIFRVKN